MGPNKDEILKNAKEAEAQEKRRRELQERDQASTDLTIRMPVGCWIWVLGAIALAFWLLKKYGPGL